LDKDGDGKLSKAEWIAGFDVFVSDSDGKITKSEFHIVSGYGFVFEMLDIDGDCRITQKEYNMGCHRRCFKQDVHNCAWIALQDRLSVHSNLWRRQQGIGGSSVVDDTALWSSQCAEPGQL
jgi:hypothetical protein